MGTTKAVENHSRDIANRQAVLDCQGSFMYVLREWGLLKDQVHLSHHNIVRRGEPVTLG